MPPKRIAVIGCGPSGLVAMKTLKEEGFEPVGFEKAHHRYGPWGSFGKVTQDGKGSIMQSTVTISSKELGAFSDFPPPADASNYMHQFNMYEYFHSYATHFDLTPHIHSNHDVIKVELADDYGDTGKFTVTYKDPTKGDTVEETFDGVLVCTGHLGYPNKSTFPDQEKFKGEIIHSHDLSNCMDFCNKVAVVVGIGNSGIDAAVEMSFYTKQVYLSKRRGTWITPRVGPNGLPFDLIRMTRFKNWLTNTVPLRTANWYYESQINSWFDHSLYGMKPDHRFLAQHVNVSDSLPGRLLNGTIKLKKNIKKFTEDGVVFQGETEVTKVDVVILATGYDMKFPVFSDSIISVQQDNQINLYKLMYPPRLPHHSLAFLGLFQSNGAVFPIAEAQARLACLVMKGEVELPSRENMEVDIRRRDTIARQRYVQSLRHTIQVDYIQFQDEINSMIGTKPNLWTLFFKDITLWYALLFGPSLPYQYRLGGPHRWPGARNAILTYMDRTIKPLREDYCPVTEKSLFQKMCLMSVLLGSAIGICAAFRQNQFSIQDLYSKIASIREYVNI